MTHNQPKNELRLFVSSTFIDLQPEREQLVKKTFPRIRAACRERGVEFTEIDLRWGITEEESRSGKTIRICLEEIDRCRPYFIGIIGSRYGWVPGITEVERDPEILTAFPWLREFAEGKKSIIEMEFAHAALNQQNDSAFFYEQLASKSNEPPLANLKSTLQTTGTPYRAFNTPEELGEQVYQDILAILDRDWPRAKELTPLEHERIEHEAFARNRRQSYVANPEYYDAFEQHVAANDAPLILWGTSGLGKSALMAYLAHEYVVREPNSFCIQHFIGAAEGSDPEDVLRQVMMEIKERYSLSEDLPTDDAKLREDFELWLAKIPTNEKLVLFIDALNQLTGVAVEMHWLPDFIPENVRLVLSTTPGPSLDELRKRNWKELELSALTSAQVEKIATTFLAQYRKHLTPKHLSLIASEAKTRRPLFLRTVLEEVRVFGRHEELEEHLQQFLSSPDERDLFQRVLARMENDHGVSEVRSVMSALWAARLGLSETEIMEITHLSRLKLSELLVAMEYHLMQREELHTFFHNYLREAVQVRYLQTKEEQVDAHATIAEYFSTREFGARRRNEEPWQWLAAENKERLKASLLEPGMLATFDTDHWRYEAFGYWRSFEKIEIDGSYVPKLTNSELPSATLVKAFENTVDLLVLADAMHQAEEFYQAGLSFIESLHIDEEKSLQLQIQGITILNHLGKTNEVILRLEETLHDKILMSAYPKLWVEILDNLAHAYSRGEHYGKAEQVLRTSVEQTRLIYGDESPQIKNPLNSLATNLAMQGRYDEAEKYLLDIVERVSDSVGISHPDYAQAQVQLASCRTLAGKLDGVIEQLERSAEILIKSFGPQHVLTCICLVRLAEAKRFSNDVLGARAILIRVMDIMTTKYPDRKDTALWGITLGLTYYLTGDFKTAIHYYERFIPNLEVLLGSDHPEVVRRRNRLIEMRAKLAFQN